MPHPLPADLGGLELPRQTIWDSKQVIPAPREEVFTSSFGHAYPSPHLLDSGLGTMAVYDIQPPSGHAKRNVLVIHGVCTPAIGQLPLTKHLQALHPDTHIVVFDLWGHGRSTTPLVPHTASIFEFQVLQVLSYMQWTKAHIVGYSFGGSIAVRFATHYPWAVSTMTLVAPAGLVNKDTFGSELNQLLVDSTGRQEEAFEKVLSFLEGGPLVVPSDWKERVQKGEVVAEALRQWELDKHAGYRHSVLSIFREGNIYDCEAAFSAYVQSPVEKLAIVAEFDPICYDHQLKNVGFANVKIVPDSDHAFIRSMPEKIARIILEFWTEVSRDI